MFFSAFLGLALDVDKIRIASGSRAEDYERSKATGTRSNFSSDLVLREAPLSH